MGLAIVDMGDAVAVSAHSKCCAEYGIKKRKVERTRAEDGEILETSTPRIADAAEKSPDTTLLCGLSEVTKAALQAAAATVDGLDVKFFPSNDMPAIGWGKKDIWNGTSACGGTAAKKRGRSINASSSPVKYPFDSGDGGRILVTQALERLGPELLQAACM